MPRASRSAAPVSEIQNDERMTRDEARRIAVNITKLPELLNAARA